MRANLYSFLTGIILLLCTFQTSSASHFLGGNFNYECLGNDVYRFYFSAYYDCISPGLIPYPPSIPVDLNQTQVSSTNCSSPTAIGAWLNASFMDVTPVCPGTTTTCTDSFSTIYGVIEGTYYRDYDFSNVTGACTDLYDISFSTCCRSSLLVNANGQSGTYISASLDINQAPCNNSPIFNSPGAATLCVTQGGMIDLSAYDPDCDSLVYSLVACQDEQGGAVFPITYQIGHTPQIPFGPQWTTSFDTQTGILTVAPNPNGSVGSYAICVEINEYRNGNLIGSIIRDMTVVSTNCPTVGSPPAFDSLYNVMGAQQVGSHNIVACIGQQLSFSFDFSDPDAGDNVFTSTNLEQVLDGAIINYTGFNPSTTLVTWTPTQADSGKTFTFYATGSGQGCPFPAQAVQVFYISVGGTCLTGDVTNTTCSGNSGAIDLSVNGGTPPFTYLWSNGATTQDITGLGVGVYTVMVSDAMGQVFTDSFVVSGTDILLNTIVNPLTCNNPNGAIGLNPSGGTAPYTYLWSTGATSSAIGGLNPGGYSVVVSDAAGCIAQEVFLLTPPDSCFVLIEGTVYDDQNGNCVQDAGEIGLPYMWVDIAPGWATLTDSSGHYSLTVDTGAYALNIIPTTFITPICPASGTHNLSFSSYDDDTTGVDFAMDFVSVQDLSVDITPWWAAVPGNIRTQFVAVYNDGSIPMSGTVTVQYDPQESFFGAQIAPIVNNPATQTLEWDFINLGPGNVFSFSFQTLVDTTAMPGNKMTTTAMVTPISGDVTPANNVDTTCVIVVASYDPNDKLVEPAGIGAEGFILPSENEMDYTVRFQNTGTYMAQYVVIRDTLDGDLDPFSFRPGGFSHPYSLNLEDDSVLVFTFANINLPDSASDPAGSQGFVSYKIDHDGTLAPGTQLHNSAAIYFDFNPPIITNTVMNTVFTYPQVAITTDSICEDESVMANMPAPGMPPYDFIWSTGDMGNGNNSGTFSAQVNGSGWYTISVTDAFGFQTEDSVFVEVAPLPQAAFSLVADATEITLSDQSTNSTSYLWDFGDGNTSNAAEPVHVYAGSGVYEVSLIVSNDCGMDTSTQSVSVFATGLEDEFGRSVRIMPNPFSQSTEISFTQEPGQVYQVQLYNQQGAVVRTYENIQNGQIRIDRNELSTGIYLFQILGPNQYAGKLIVR